MHLVHAASRDNLLGLREHLDRISEDTVLNLNGVAIHLIA
jgi:hypothetical protein